MRRVTPQRGCRDALQSNMNISTQTQYTGMARGVAKLLHLSARQDARIVACWVESIGLDASSYGTSTMRRTKATLIYRRTMNLRTVQLLLGHPKLESTVHYLGIEDDDALKIAKQKEV